MTYLTFDEGKVKFPYLESIDEAEFNRLLRRASLVLDNATHGFYRKHELSTDKITERKEAFLEALALTIEQMNVTGIETSIDVQTANIMSVSIGKTQLTKLSGGAARKAVNFSMIPVEALYLLTCVGLLYKGVRYV